MLAPWTFERRMSPPAPQVPDRPAPTGRSQMGTGAPPSRPTRFSWPAVKKPTDRPSGEKKSEVTPSVPARGRGWAWERSRIQMCRPSRVVGLPSAADDGSGDVIATNATLVPSGETAIEVVSTLEAKVPPAGGGTRKRTTCGSREGVGRDPSTATTATTVAAAAASQGIHRAIGEAPRGRETERGSTSRREPDASPSIQASSRPRSAALCHRSSGSLARHVLTTLSSAGGTRPFEDVRGGGSLARIAVRTLFGESPGKARFPVTISKRTAPRAKMSDRASAGLPSTCSGARYADRPENRPGAGERKPLGGRLRDLARLDPLPHSLVRGVALREDLDGDVAAQPGVPRAIDLPHPSCPDRGDQLVGAQAISGGKLPGSWRSDLGNRVRPLPATPPPDTHWPEAVQPPRVTSAWTWGCRFCTRRRAGPRRRSRGSGCGRSPARGCRSRGSARPPRRGGRARRRGGARRGLPRSPRPSRGGTRAARPRASRRACAPDRQRPPRDEAMAGLVSTPRPQGVR